MKEIMQRLERIELYSLMAAKSVLTVNEAALFMGVSVQTIRKKVRSKEIPAYKPNHNILYFKKSDLEDWMLRNRIKTDAEVKSEAKKYCLTH